MGVSCRYLGRRSAVARVVLAIVSLFQLAGPANVWAATLAGVASSSRMTVEDAAMHADVLGVEMDRIAPIYEKYVIVADAIDQATALMFAYNNACFPHKLGASDDELTQALVSRRRNLERRQLEWIRDNERAYFEHLNTLFPAQQEQITFLQQAHRRSRFLSREAYVPRLADVPGVRFDLLQILDGQLVDGAPAMISEIMREYRVRLDRLLERWEEAVVDQELDSGELFRVARVAGPDTGAIDRYLECEMRPITMSLEIRALNLRTIDHVLRLSQQMNIPAFCRQFPSGVRIPRAARFIPGSSCVPG